MNPIKRVLHDDRVKALLIGFALIPVILVFLELVCRLLLVVDLKAPVYAPSSRTTLRSGALEIVSHLNLDQAPFKGARLPEKRMMKWDFGDFWDQSSHWVKPNTMGIEKGYDSETGALLHEARFSTDAFGNRRIPSNPESIGNVAQHFVAYGCSFTWGEGVEDHETYPARMAEKLKGTRFYSFAKPGAGPGDLIGRLQQLDSSTVIGERKGIGVYVHIGGHIKRFLQLTSVTGNWGSRLRYAEEIEEGRFVDRGPTNESRKVYTAIQRLLWSSAFIRYFHIEWPLVLASDVRRYVRSIDFIRREYRRATSEENPFYFVIFPGDDYKRAELREALDQYGIPFLDYGDVKLQEWLGEQKATLPDYHPSPEAYRFFADLLVRDLKLDSTRAASAR